MQLDPFVIRAVLKEESWLTTFQVQVFSACRRSSGTLKQTLLFRRSSQSANHRGGLGSSRVFILHQSRLALALRHGAPRTSAPSLKRRNGGAMKNYVTTRDAVPLFGVMSARLRIAYCTKSHLRPVKLPNRLLMWSLYDIEALLQSPATN